MNDDGRNPHHSPLRSILLVANSDDAVPIGQFKQAYKVVDGRSRSHSVCVFLVIVVVEVVASLILRSLKNFFKAEYVDRLRC